MNRRQTPGVYVDFDESRRQRLNAIPSAVPAFIGYTENNEIDKGQAYSVYQFQVAVKDEKGEDTLFTQEVVTHKVGSLRDFTSTFGNQQNFAISIVHYDTQDPKKIDRVELEDRFFLYDSVKLFYENGGGECFIVSIGQTPYKKKGVDVDKDDTEKPHVTTDFFLNGLQVASHIPEVTLLLMPDLQVFSERTELDLAVIYNAALRQCSALKDRMVIFDVPMKLIDQGGGVIDPESKLYKVDIGPFRSSMLANQASFRENNPLMYGAAYYPWLYTNFFYVVDLKRTVILDSEQEPAIQAASSVAKGQGCAHEVADKPSRKKGGALDELHSLKKITEIAKSRACSKKEHRLLDQLTKDLRSCQRILDRRNFSKGGLSIQIGSFHTVTAGSPRAANQVRDAHPLAKANKRIDFDIIEAANEVETISDLQAAILMALRKVPPSGAIAGLIAKTDREEGVWKAPANTPLEGVLGPVLRIDPGLQQDMNVHGTGLSVNAIQSAIGRGTFVWGARTLDSNNLDWRYIPVRRLFIYVEQSIKRRMRDFVFEDNDRDTWIQIKLLIEDFLISIWRNGGLNGQTPAEAFFVKVGLEETMTQLDILEGRMIVEIGLAAVRPLEFIKLVFTAKLEEGII